eukprot:2764357-Amphidinium_carterae.1
MKVFKEHVVRTKYTSRRMFHHDVLNAVVKNMRLNGFDVQETDSYQVVAFMQAHVLMLSHPFCPKYETGVSIKPAFYTTFSKKIALETRFGSGTYKFLTSKAVVDCIIHAQFRYTAFAEHKQLETKTPLRSTLLESRRAFCINFAWCGFGAVGLIHSCGGVWGGCC